MYIELLNTEQQRKLSTYNTVRESYAHDNDLIARLGSLVIIRSVVLFAFGTLKSRMNIFITPPLDGERYARYFPSGDSNGDVFSGLPNSTSRGMSSSEVVRLLENKLVVVVSSLVLGVADEIAAPRGIESDDIGDMNEDANIGRTATDARKKVLLTVDQGIVLVLCGRSILCVGRQKSKR